MVDFRIKKIAHTNHMDRFGGIFDPLPPHLVFWNPPLYSKNIFLKNTFLERVSKKFTVFSVYLYFILK